MAPTVRWTTLPSVCLFPRQLGASHDSRLLWLRHTLGDGIRVAVIQYFPRRHASKLEARVLV